MTNNTAQARQHFPPPDFGPAPLTLPPQTQALRGPNSLREHAQHHGLLSGAAVVVHALEQDPALQQLVAQQCAILVPEVELKWVALRPSATAFDFSVSDKLFAFAKQHRMQVRGHTLTWHNSVPDWLRENAATLDVRALFIEHIQTVVGRYRGRVQSWDVVNEAILPADNQPQGLRNTFWYQHVGPDYIELAFRTARAADPNAKLTYNDYSVEYDNAGNGERRTLILALVQRLKAAGVPLDAVGIQAHISAAQPDSIGRGLSEYIEAIQKLGLEVYLTELDVNEDDIASNDPAERDRIVAETYTQLLRTALSNPAVKLVLTWGMSDRRTWLNDGPTHHRKQPGRPQRSLPFDPQYRPAPAFYAMRDCFDQRSAPSASS